MNLTEALHVSTGRRYIHPGGLVSSDGTYDKRAILLEAIDLGLRRAARFNSPKPDETLAAFRETMQRARIMWRMANPDHPKTRAYFAGAPDLCTLGD